MVTQPNQFPQINIRTKMKTDLNRGHFFLYCYHYIHKRNNNNNNDDKKWKLRDEIVIKRPVEVGYFLFCCFIFPQISHDFSGRSFPSRQLGWFIAQQRPMNEQHRLLILTNYLLIYTGFAIDATNINYGWKRSI